MAAGKIQAFSFSISWKHGGGPNVVLAWSLPICARRGGRVTSAHNFSQVCPNWPELSMWAAGCTTNLGKKLSSTRNLHSSVRNAGRLRIFFENMMAALCTPLSKGLRDRIGPCVVPWAKMATVIKMILLLISSTFNSFFSWSQSEHSFPPMLNFDAHFWFAFFFLEFYISKPPPHSTRQKRKTHASFKKKFPFRVSLAPLRRRPGIPTKFLQSIHNYAQIISQHFPSFLSFPTFRLHFNFFYFSLSLFLSQLKPFIFHLSLFTVHRLFLCLSFLTFHFHLPLITFHLSSFTSYFLYFIMCVKNQKAISLTMTLFLR